MTGDPVAAFFEDLVSGRDEPSLRKVTGTVRFDLSTGKTTERWLVGIRKGHLTVSHKGGAADTVVRLSRRLFEGMASGETNILSAMLRGEVELEGDYRLMIVLRRIIRKRAAVRHPAQAAGYARRQG